MSHASGAPRESADPTSIIVVDEAPKKASLADFFSFNSPGEFTWWAGAILGVLGCCAFASIIIINVKSNTREPPAVMMLLSAQQCPFLSSLTPPLPFTGSVSRLPAVKRGGYLCATAADCVALGSEVEDPKLLALLQCAKTPIYSVKGLEQPKVCVYPSLNSTAAPSSSSVSSPSPGFCTSAGTTCALCLDGACGSTTLWAGSVGCPLTSSCSSSSWRCRPLVGN